MMPIYSIWGLSRQSLASVAIAGSKVLGIRWSSACDFTAALRSHTDVGSLCSGATSPMQK